MNSMKSKGSDYPSTNHSDDSSGITIRFSTSGDNDDDWEDECESVSENDHTKQSSDTWVPFEKTAKVNGREIPGGLYAGKELYSVRGLYNRKTKEPALINPKYKVRDALAHEHGNLMNYWPSYNELKPECRGAYLDWQETGRKKPDAYIGYVFLYYYGLERRAIFESKFISEAKQDLQNIRDEVQRLLSIYGGNRSFNNYASAFYDTLGLMIHGATSDISPDMGIMSSGVSGSIKAGIGIKLLQGESITARWALPWAWQDNEIGKNTAIKRCPKEFMQLFIDEFNAKYPKGLALKPNKTKLKMTYHTASGGLKSLIEPLTFNGETIPDVTVLKRPRNILNELTISCAEQLDSYSRFLGRNNNSKDSIEALAYLPPSLLSRYKHPALNKIKQMVKEALNDQDYGSLNAEQLFEIWPVKSKEKMAKKELVGLSQLLEGMGVGLEPDARFNTVTVTPKTRAIVFKIASTSPTTPSPEYMAACNLLHLASIVSFADGTVSKEEELQLEQQLENQVGLYPEERVRLKGHMKYLLANPLKATGLNKRVKHITDQQKSAITSFLIDVALADGHVDPSEVKVLEKIYKALGLENDDLYSHIHSASTGLAAQIRVKPQVATPVAGELPAERQALDPELLKKKLEETEAVSGILSSILGEEEPTLPVPTVADDSDGIAGLDAAHSKLLLTLGTKDQWPRSDLEMLIEETGLFFDGALDTINEASYDCCDTPVIEEDEDVYYVDVDIFKELTHG
ncbi:MAG: hypothetical protein GXP23_06530 [Gammaproteobacteria bacterium]|nr:hypothetical protein [Gammaproteobacteria bacterium]